MERALIIGDTGGIGAALAQTLRDRGTDVTGLSRRDGFDLSDPASIATTMARLTPPFDLIIIATGILAPPGQSPEKSLRPLDATTMAQVFAINTIGPAMVLRESPRLLPRTGRAVLAVLSARVGSIGDNRLGGWHSYRASKSALNQILRGAAIELARTHRDAACVALHPGTVATPFTAAYAGTHPTVPPATAAANLLTVIDGLTPAATGSFLDWQGQTIPW
jgi:NAD(P)-dependent dehydrogenase (short-subunit alcohol dehydrogenase family)